MSTLRTLIWILLTALCLAPAAGCSCWKDPLAKVEDKKKPETLEELEARRKELQSKQEEKPDFETVRLTVLPADDAPTRNHVKPGHWFNAVQTMKANNFDFPKADLEAQCVNTVGKPIPLPGSQFELRTRRPVSLPQGQSKHFDLLLFANMDRANSAINFITKLRPRGGGREVDWKHEACTRMKPFQNHMVVLAERVDNYQFVKALRSVKPERPTDEFLAAELDYFVKLPKGTRRVDLPSHPLAWSNIAYVIWDDYEPEILNLSQQQAMVDWLHWGGQLIINGPRTLDRLAGSFLAPYLPARAGTVGTLTDAQREALNENWSFALDDFRPLRVANGQEPPLTVSLELIEDATHVPNTADLTAERQVGRGRIIATGFNLPHPVMLAWDAYDTFFNSVLLARPARQYYPTAENIEERWVPTGVTRDDPRVNSKLRYFSRDAMAESTRSQRFQQKAAAEANVASTRRSTRDAAEIAKAMADAVADIEAEADIEPEQDPALEPSDLHRVRTDVAGIVGFANDDKVGVAGWTDKSDVSQAARSALQKSAGISVPSIDFIAKVLGIYLAVLVPINWLIFRLMGRVEWAWAAVPIIAIGGALGVVQAAQLDIGFARSRTEVAVVELQPDYNRGHLTRYVGLYTSLSSSYQVVGQDESALFQPLASAQRAAREVAIYQGEDVQLSGFNVLSNSTGMIHSEEMAPVGGTISLSEVAGRTVVQNQTDHALRGCCVVRRRPDSKVEMAWLGELPEKGQQDVTFQPLTTANVEFAEWENDPATSRDVAEGVLNIRRIIEIATDPKRLGVQEAVLVGWTDQTIGGVRVVPEASQTTTRTLFVAQLRHAERPAPQKDLSSYAVLKRNKTRDDKEESEYSPFQ